jgi:hypothetical protein
MCCPHIIEVVVSRIDDTCFDEFPIFMALLTSSWVADSRGRKTFTDGKPGWEAAARRS